MVSRRTAAAAPCSPCAISARATATWRAVRGVSFDVRAGEVVVIIGPSGCGKSTTLRCLNLLEEPTGGTLKLDDRELDFARRRTLPSGRDLARFRARFGPVRAQDGDRKRHDRPGGGEENPAGPSPPHGHGPVAPGRPRRHGEPPAARAVRRPAAAGGHRAGARHVARSAAVRRGDLRARPGAGGRGAGSDARSRQGRRDHGRGHPRDGLCPRRRGSGAVHGSGGRWWRMGSPPR